MKEIISVNNEAQATYLVRFYCKTRLRITLYSDNLLYEHFNVRRYLWSSDMRD